MEEGESRCQRTPGVVKEGCPVSRRRIDGARVGCVRTIAKTPTDVCNIWFRAPAEASSIKHLSILSSPLLQRYTKMLGSMEERCTRCCARLQITNILAGFQIIAPGIQAMTLYVDGSSRESTIPCREGSGKQIFRLESSPNLGATWSTDHMLPEERRTAALDLSSESPSGLQRHK
jgi:hypothetical protein